LITPAIITLSDLSTYSVDLLAGRVRGRMIVDVKA
jgi:hypothetical protein